MVVHIRFGSSFLRMYFAYNACVCNVGAAVVWDVLIVYHLVSVGAGDPFS